MGNPWAWAYCRDCSYWNNGSCKTHGVNTTPNSSTCRKFEWAVQKPMRVAAKIYESDGSFIHLETKQMEQLEATGYFRVRSVWLDISPRRIMTDAEKLLQVFVDHPPSRYTDRNAIFRHTCPWCGEWSSMYPMTEAKNHSHNCVWRRAKECLREKGENAERLLTEFAKKIVGKTPCFEGWGKTQCWYCDLSFPDGDIDNIDISRHEEGCIWRLAKEYLKAQHECGE